jgi:hypothetical protein
MRATDLQYFLDRYLGQDWDIEGDTYQEAVQAAISIERDGLLRNVRNGLQAMLEANQSEEGLAKAAWDEGMAYGPEYDDMTYRSFFEHVIKLLDQRVDGTQNRV